MPRTIFQFIIHNGNFNSLHRSLIQEWHSELFDLINCWLAVGPDDSLKPFWAHFASYHDINVSCFIRFSIFILISNSRFLPLTEISQTKHQKFYTMRSLVLSFYPGILIEMSQWVHFHKCKQLGNQ